MIDLFMRCGAKEKKHFLMPRGLRYIRELAKEGIDWRGLHMVDAVSLYCAIQIDRAREYLRIKSQERMRKAGIKSITPATEADFESL